MVFIFKLLLIVLLLFIIANLAKALIEMVKSPDEDEPNKSDEPPMSHYLGQRLVLSALAVVLLIVALLSGFIDANVRPY
ncbi:hypothetical protein VII00023_05667 [Vibrio ichthyoenteri ATCC 700023]|uniref:DUF2909 domain-containing protein n=1 Tax=Vibrio ichthyoenteri ATCC 700023 TaxID=870968 RepID=F9S6C7_9VIBR|nr:DUF2909 domain-containing protein [Vibrio ichthyoenteri]EGU33753.1 hypothetical protein VII00023_05667 [Vibrio ichthyoenteri ATCC 700023]